MRLTPEELSARKKRNLAIAGALVAFVILLFTVTFLRMKSNLDARAEMTAAGRTMDYVQ